MKISGNVLLSNLRSSLLKNLQNQMDYVGSASSGATVPYKHANACFLLPMVLIKYFTNMKVDYNEGLIAWVI